MSTPSHFSRRRFLKTSAATASAAPFVTSGLRAQSPNGKLQHASVGGAGMAWADISSLTGNPEEIDLVAVAEVDRNRLKDLSAKFPNTRIYEDWREMLDKEADKIDSVNISTPDHMHGPAAMAALAKGKHVYGQKPMTQNLFECRKVQEAAAKTGKMTQMGIQVSSAFSERLAVALVQNRSIGEVREVHTFSNKKWGDLDPKPDRSDPVPDNLNWDLWLGPAEERPFIKGYYHPGAWRKRRDFGTGTLGDMGCHIFSGWFRALDLTAPTSVRATGPASNKDNWSINNTITYTFPGTKFTDDDKVKVTWYDGDARPPADVLALVGDKVPGQGSIIIGTSGAMLAPHMSTPRLFPADKFKGHRYPKLKPRNHYQEFVDRCLDGEGKPSANFDYAGRLTESVLLGCLATLYPEQELLWDTEKLRFTNSEEATSQVKRTYRPGWELTEV